MRQRASRRHPGAQEGNNAPPPLELLDVLQGKTGRHRSARDHLKQYNNAFSFVSYGQDCFAEKAGGRGPPVVLCHGTVHHRTGFLLPEEGQDPKYAQVYLYDQNEAAQVRKANVYNQGLDASVLDDFQAMLDRVSPYVRVYRSMREIVAEHAPAEVGLGIAATPGSDMRRYNKPTQYEPAVVFFSPDGTPPTNRDIAVWPRNPNTGTYRISDKCEHVDPLAYPLLFPFGDGGWHHEMKHEGGKGTVALISVASKPLFSPHP